MKHIILTLLLALLGANHVWSRPTVNDLLDSLDEYMAHQEQYDAKRKARITAAKVTARNASDVRQAMLAFQRLGEEYMAVNLDSASYWLTKGQQTAFNNGRIPLAMHLKMLNLQVLPLRGLIGEAVDSFTRINRRELAKSELALYYETGHRIYDFAAGAFPSKQYSEHCRKLSLQYADSLVNELRPGSDAYIFYKGLIDLHGDEATAKAARTRMQQQLENLRYTDEFYARIAALIAEDLMQRGQYDEADRYLALSSISDVVCGNAETTSLHRLGHRMYRQGQDWRAYKYLTRSLERSVASGASLRSTEVLKCLPVVLDETNRAGQAHSRILLIVIGILLCVTMAMGVLLYDNVRKRRKLAQLQSRLSRTHTIKDDYLRQFIMLCGSHISTLEQLSLIAVRKLKARQFDDLLQIIETGKAVRDNLADFYRVFDDAFLALYPDFVTKVNQLFAPDKQIEQPNPGEGLTTELRLLAFMRMGIDDPAQLARFLGLSVNTVYAYRTRLKNRATNRETFEADIINIDHTA